MRFLHCLLLIACGAPSVAPYPKAPPCPSVAQAPVVAPKAVVKMTPKETLEKIFTEAHADRAWFQDAFLRAVPIEKIDAIKAQLTSSLGAFEGVRDAGKEHHYEVKFAKGTLSAVLILEDGKIQTLFLKPGETAASSLDEALAPLRALPGKRAFAVVAADGKPLARENESAPLAVGSAFKLAVLAELVLMIEQKKQAWDRVVSLDARARSLPSGVLHEWPDKTPLTVQTLASLMISISDNTATDAVIDLVGRATLTAKHGAFKPFLKTSEMFRLKAKGSEAALERFRSATPQEREKMLAEIDKLPLPKAEDYPKGVTAIDVEWHFSASELCALMGKVRDLPLMGINPGVAKKSDWDKVAYKGGSEPGVINMTTWVQKGSRSYCVVATWNDDKPLEEERFALAYGGVLSFLAKNLP